MTSFLVAVACSRLHGSHLPHDADLLRQRRAAPRSHLHDVIADTVARFHRKPRRRDLLPDRHRRARRQDRRGGGRGRRDAEGATPTASAALFRDTWDACGITLRPLHPHHRRAPRAVRPAGARTQVYARGDIYFGDYGGLYCTGCERFYTEKELVDGKCPDHKIVPEFVKEENYFFRMSKLPGAAPRAHRAQPRLDPARALPQRGARLAARAARGSLHLAPEEPPHLGHRAAVRRRLRHLRVVRRAAQLRERRRSSRRERFFGDYWPAAEHFIAKDILKPHGVYWPTMLMAAGLPLYRHLNVHGYWTVEGDKMSKSLGNVIAPLDDEREVRERRVPLLPAARERLRSRRRLPRGGPRHTLQRRPRQQHRQSGEPHAVDAAALLPGRACPRRRAREPIDRALAEAFAGAEREIDEHMATLGFNRALEALLRATDHANKYIVETAPFTLAKRPEADAARRERSFDHLAEALLRTARLAAPFLPDTAARIVDLLNLPQSALRSPSRPGGGISAEHRVKPSVVLFPRIEPRR